MLIAPPAKVRLTELKSARTATAVQVGIVNQNQVAPSRSFFFILNNSHAVVGEVFLNLSSARCS